MYIRAVFYIYKIRRVILLLPAIRRLNMHLDFLSPFLSFIIYRIRMLEAGYVVRQIYKLPFSFKKWEKYVVMYSV